MRDWIARSLTIAAAIWGVAGFQTETGYPRVRPYPMPADVLGDALPPATIEYNRNWSFTWMQFCTTVAHEYGHLLGHEDNLNPNSIMYAYDRPDWRCSDYGRPFLRRVVYRLEPA